MFQELIWFHGCFYKDQNGAVTSQQTQKPEKVQKIVCVSKKSKVRATTVLDAACLMLTTTFLVAGRVPICPTIPPRVINEKLWLKADHVQWALSLDGKNVIYQQDLGILNPRIEDP